ncbi:CueP family metal-binding protein [Brevibacterium album]|uniref:CueP family metal-binding protein n=1 Tax=Brevibacterium album TaxID=417948 RepID=UPI000408FD8D|nr:CueP family metal-binding protein [Brevibacterium album]
MNPLASARRLRPAHRPRRTLAVALLAGALTLTGCSAEEVGLADQTGSAGQITPSDASEGESPVGGPGDAAEASEGVQDVLAAHGLADLPAEEIIARLDALPLAERPADLLASVLPGELVLTDGAGEEARLPMPEDRFYVSLAPYAEQTHECHFHSLTTCLGELRNAPVSVTVTDAETGEGLLDEELSTYDNGFVGLWLPRGITAEITVEHEGRQAHDTVSTRAGDDATCLTDLRLV